MPPHGYERVRVPNDKGWTLRPVETDIVRFIFRLYTSGEEEDGGSVKRSAHTRWHCALTKWGSHLRAVRPVGAAPQYSKSSKTLSTSGKSAGTSASRKSVSLTRPSGLSVTPRRRRSRFSWTACTPPLWTRPCSSPLKEAWKDRPAKNLEWATAEENTNYGSRTARAAVKNGSRTPIMQIDPRTRKGAVEFPGQSAAAKATGIAASCINAIDTVFVKFHVTSSNGSCLQEPFCCNGG